MTWYSNAHKCEHGIAIGECHDCYPPIAHDVNQIKKDIAIIKDALAQLVSLIVDAKQAHSERKKSVDDEF